MIVHHDWKRFFCEREHSYALDDNGFLAEFEDEENKKYIQPHLEEVSALTDEKCLVILGEPGIGKSKILKEEYERESQLSFSIYKELNDYDSRDHLVRDIFESQEFAKWLLSNETLTLFLDSLDEGLLNIKILSRILVKELGKISVERFKIRISCRTSIWPEYLEVELNQIFNHKIKIVELVPLRKRDVAIACRDYGLDSKIVIEKIIDKKVVAFSTKPNTLKFLLMTFQNKGELPETKQEIYRIGCELHCEESNLSRGATRKLGVLTPKQRTMIASRIAALMIFSNKMTVSLSNNYSNEKTLSIDEIINEAGLDVEYQIKLTADLIKDEILDTGLFTSRGLNLMGWSHQSYAEFLASSYLIRHQYPISQLNFLFFDNYTSEPKIIPSLQETAAWTAIGRQDFLDLILDLDTEILLPTDLSQLQDNVKEKIIYSLIEMVGEDKTLIGHRYNTTEMLKHLKHEGIANQLRPFLANENIENKIVKFILDLIEACKVDELFDDVCNIVFNENVVASQRINAAYAIKNAGRLEDKEKISLMLSFPLDNKLRTCLLTIAWPEFINLKDLLPILTIPTGEKRFGGYSAFLNYNFLKHLKNEDLPEVCSWIRFNLKEKVTNSEAHYFLKFFIEKFWKGIETEESLDSFAMVVYDKFQDYRDFTNDMSDTFKKEYWENYIFRRRLLSFYIEKLTGEEFKKLPTTSLWSMINQDDVQWLFSQLHPSLHTEKKVMIARLLRLTLNIANSDCLILVLDYSEKFVEIKNEFLYQVGPIDFGTQMEQNMKEIYLAEKRTSRKSKEVDYAKVIFNEMNSYFSSIESNEINCFFNIVRLICFNAKEKYHNEALMDLRKGEFWYLVETDKLEIFKKYSKVYLDQYVIDVLDGISKGHYISGVLVGLKALILINNIDPDYVNSLPVSFWKKWIPAIVGYDFGDDKNITRKIEEIAFEKDPESFLKALRSKMKADAEIHKVLFTFKRLKILLSEKDIFDLYTYFINEKMQTTTLIYLLSGLIGESSLQTEVWLIDFIKNSKLNKHISEEILLAASVLLRQVPSKGVKTIQKASEKKSDFLRQMFLNNKVFSLMDENEFFNQLSEHDLASFYILMESNFPYFENIVEKKGNEKLNNAYSIKSRTLNNLTGKGTRESCSEITRIITKFPSYDFLKLSLLQAEIRHRAVQWQPISSKELLLMSSNFDNRLIRNIGDLHNCVLESLGRFQLELQGHTPTVEGLWNTRKSEFTPKNEDVFSDSIKNYLNKDLKLRGIIINREVEIRKTPKGLRTDIHIDAFAKDSTTGKLTLVVEVKGCWNKEVFEAMESQLANHYLSAETNNHGIFIIGNFHCDIWTGVPGAERSRKAQSKRNDILNNKFLFEFQAEVLKQTGVIISPVIIDARYRV